VLIDREELVASLRARSIVPIDAQAPGWYESERLPGARRARPEDLDSLHMTLPDGRDTELAVYCWDRGCEASAQVARLLIERGYTRVRRYVGGKRDWIAAGLPVERGAP
jgi:rhodanese-related sulfurtransferase